MEINFSQILPLLIAWADGADPDDRKRGRKHVGDKIASSAQKLGIACGLDTPETGGDLHNNQQRIFRWAEADTAYRRRKLTALFPAIIDALPDGLAAQLLVMDSLQYRSLQAAERNIKKATSEFIRANKAIAIQELRAERRSDNGNGPAGNSLFH
ncbi:toxin YdaT family protein [Enterobacter asburiae]|uniref:toxin YdaT family protein n=1 Tax=Enterobacter asburiae TaxID=61645 RepID=UPI003BDC6200